LPFRPVLVGNPLLSERDGNISSLSTLVRAKYWSETHYSLKEMETRLGRVHLAKYSYLVGNPLLSERDGNSSSLTQSSILNFFVGNPLLSERDGN